jgi:hypothetical protein
MMDNQTASDTPPIAMVLEAKLGNDDIEKDNRD